VPRHHFIDAGFSQMAYEENVALPIGYQQTISQASNVAMMTDWLFSENNATGQPNRTIKRVLEIGTGSGYQTAILSVLAEEVYTLERIKPLADQAQQKLLSMGLHNIYFGNADGHIGWPDQAPFDAILSAAAPKELPMELINQLAIGGRLVSPIGDTNQKLYGYVRHADHLQECLIAEASFVPMLEGISG